MLSETDSDKLLLRHQAESGGTAGDASVVSSASRADYLADIEDKRRAKALPPRRCDETAHREAFSVRVSAMGKGEVKKAAKGQNRSANASTN